MRPKFKKAIAILLAVMLLAASLPMSAMAAVTDPNDHKVNVKMALVSVDADVKTAISGNTTQFGNAVEDALDGTDYNSGVRDRDGADAVKTNVELLNGLATDLKSGDKDGTTSGKAYQVDKGDTFVLALDIDLATADMSSGVADSGITATSSFALELPHGAFSHAANAGKISLIDTGEAFGRVADSAIITQLMDSYPGESGFTLSTSFSEGFRSKNKSNDPQDYTHDELLMTVDSGTGLLPKDATWDIYLVLTAKEAGTHEITLMTYYNSDSLTDFNSASGGSIPGFQLAMSRDGSGTATNTRDGNNPVNLNPSSIWIEVVGTDPVISIPAGTSLNPDTNQSLTVTLKNGTFDGTPAANTDIKVVASDGDVAGAITNVGAPATGADGSVTVALTIDGTKLVGKTGLKIEVAAGKIKDKSSVATQAALQTGEFTVKTAIAGKPEISGTPTYGETLTAKTSDATSPVTGSDTKYQWYRGTTAINGATNATYKLDKADVGQQIKVVVSDGALYGSVESDPTTAVAKIQLARPASGDLGISVDPVLQNATSGLTKTATYKFTTGVINGDNVTVNVTATYTDVATTGPKTLTGATMSDTLATGGDWYTLAAANSEEYTVSGTVNPAGYSLAKETTNGKTITWESPIDNTNPYVGVPGPEGKANGTVEGLGASESLTSLTAKNRDTGATVGSVEITDAEHGKFTWTAPTTAISGLVNVTFTESSASEKDVTATIPAKEYDGTTAVVGTITLSEDVGFVVTGGTYDTAEVGTDKTVTLTWTGDTTIVDGATTYHLVTTAKGEIEKISEPTVTATVADNTLKGTSKIEDVIAAIKAAPVLLDGVTYGEGENEGTVGDYFDDDAIIALLKEAYPECFTEGAEGEEGTWNFKGMQNKDLDLHFDLSEVATGDLAKHADLTDATLDFHTKFKKDPPAGGSGVNLDAGGYGTVIGDESVELDGEGHIKGDLPTVKTKAGVVFLGWTDEEGSSNIIDPETKVLEEDDTLYAVYAGYVAGDGNGKVRPAANVLRKELARMLLVAAGLYDRNEDYTATAANNFPDMPKDGWSDNYLARAKELKIMLGDAETGKVRPNDPITREEAAIMIAKTFEVMTKDGATTDKLADFAKVSDWAQKYVAALYDNGTVNGYPEEEGENTFRPKTNISRQEVAVMINKYLGLTSDDIAAIKIDPEVKNPFTDIKATDWAYAHVMFASLSVPASYYVDEITQPTRAD